MYKFIRILLLPAVVTYWWYRLLHHQCFAQPVAQGSEGSLVPHGVNTTFVLALANKTLLRKTFDNNSAETKALHTAASCVFHLCVNPSPSRARNLLGMEQWMCLSFLPAENDGDVIFKVLFRRVTINIDLPPADG